MSGVDEESLYGGIPAPPEGDPVEFRDIGNALYRACNRDSPVAMNATNLAQAKGYFPESREHYALVAYYALRALHAANKRVSDVVTRMPMTPMIQAEATVWRCKLCGGEVRFSSVVPPTPR